jgi:hypothetical protein
MKRTLQAGCLKPWPTILLFFVLSGCGAESEAPQDQGIGLDPLLSRDNLSSPNTITSFTGSYIQNPVEDVSGLEVLYRSSNSSVVAVDESGGLNTISEGVAAITAVIPKSSIYEETVISYEVHVAPKKFGVIARLGLENTNVVFPEYLKGFEFARSSDKNCNFESVSNCANGAANKLLGLEIDETATNLNRASLYQLTLNEQESKSRLSPSITINASQQSVVFNDRMWIVGGQEKSTRTPTDPYIAEVWSSKDGAKWVLETSNPGFSARYGHQVIVHDNKFWLIGGYDETGRRGDVWSSENGINWGLVTENADFSARYHHEAVSFNGRLWVIGGVVGNGGSSSGDVWSSINGVTWTLESTIPRRFNHRSIVFDNELYVVAGTSHVSFGFGEVGELNDVWKTNNGVDWIQLTEEAAFSKRFGHELIVSGNQLLLLGGREGGFSFYPPADVWTTQDGIDWELVGEEGAAPVSSFFQALSFKGDIFTVGGDYRKDSWATSDGVSWNEKKEKTAQSAEYFKYSVSFKGKLWSIPPYQNEVWSSMNGIDWALEKTETSFENRRFNKILKHKDQLWLIGGFSLPESGIGFDEYFRDVFVSNDGLVWNKVYESTPFEDQGVEFISHAERVYAVGGYDGSNYINEVWSSIDGQTWRQETSDAEFSPRGNFALTSYQSRMLLIGGNDNEDRNDIWSSSNGSTWQLEKETSEFSARQGHSVIEKDNQLLLISGYGAEDFQDIWMSPNGIDWELSIENALYPSSYSTNVKEFNGQLYISSHQGGELWSSVDGFDWRLNKHVEFDFQ